MSVHSAGRSDSGARPVNFRRVLPGSAPVRGPLFRSAALLSGSPDGLPPELVAGPAGTYLDLRTDREVRRDGAPAALLAAGWHWVRHAIDDTGTPYGPAEVLDRTRAAARLAWTRAARGPVVVACSLGKDRTGRVAAVLQHWCGLAPEASVADYLRSNRELADSAAGLPERWQAAGAVTPVHGRDLERLLELLRHDSRWAAPPVGPGRDGQADDGRVKRDLV